MKALSVSLTTFFLLVGCHAGKAGPPRPGDDDAIRAGDAGYIFTEGKERDASAILPLTHVARPSLTLVAGTPGGRGDLDGVGGEARIGLAAGMVRVGETLVFADQGNGTLRRFVPATRRIETLVRLPRTEDGRAALPAFLAYDGARRVFVTDRSRHVVYGVDLETKEIAVVAGRPSLRGDT